MSVEFIHAGNAIDYTPGADVVAGAVVVQEELVGVTKRSIKSGELGALVVVGVFDFPKETGAGNDIPAGLKVYWHPVDQLVKKTSVGAVYLGKAVLTAAEGDETVRVRLEQ